MIAACAEYWLSNLMFYAGVKVDAQQSDALVRGKRECVDQVVIATIVVLQFASWLS